ncbi:internal scaffolding protein [Blackfly microvirus SF02]|uniref:Internal scaffolding protein n=1 Tax=Blackfly microvirus SF02 TaxID=2576452 RepID=A0A4P8PL04_9VIRU|nr:internal scaffolding protein [Blackfly microvirus SF02]
MKNTIIKHRTQNDGLGNEASDAGGITFDPTDTLVRQEFKDECDLNILLARFGINTQVRTDGIYTETDYNLDLQQALAAMASARQANLDVPEELRNKYPDWLAVLEGADNGTYQKDLQILADRKAREKAEADSSAAYNAEKAGITRRQKAERELAREREDATGQKATEK